MNTNFKRLIGIVFVVASVGLFSQNSFACQSRGDCKAYIKGHCASAGYKGYCNWNGKSNAGGCRCGHSGQI